MENLRDARAILERARELDGEARGVTTTLVLTMVRLVESGHLMLLESDRGQIEGARLGGTTDHNPERLPKAAAERRALEMAKDLGNTRKGISDAVGRSTRWVRRVINGK